MAPLTPTPFRPVPPAKRPAEVRSLKLCDGFGRDVEPMVHLGGGAEGSVYRISDTQVVKLFKPSPRLDELHSKVVEMSQFSRELKGTYYDRVHWPLAAVYGPRRNFVGYTMIYTPGVPLLHALRGTERLEKGWGDTERVQICTQMARVFAALHEKGICVGDPSSNNLFVSRAPDGRPRVTVIDADSFQFGRYKCTVRTPRYARPSVVRGEDEPRASEHNDNFVLAFLAFEMLLLGLSPYAHRGGDSPSENLAKQLVAVGAYSPKEQKRLVPKGPFLERWERLPKPLQVSFLAAFKREAASPAAVQAALFDTALSPFAAKRSRLRFLTPWRRVS